MYILALLSLLPTAQAAEPGAIQVNVPNTPGEIVLDGFNTGKFNPATIASVQPGDHEVELRYGCLVGKATVTVQSGQTVKVAPRMNNIGGDGTLRLKGVPAGAEVFVDNRPIGAADKGVPLKCGGHTISIEAPGYATWKQETVVSTDIWSTIEVKMKAETLAAPPVIATAPIADEEGEVAVAPVVPSRSAPVAAPETPDEELFQDDDEEHSEPPELRPASPTGELDLGEEEEEEAAPARTPPRAVPQEPDEVDEPREREPREREPRERREREHDPLKRTIGFSATGGLAVAGIVGLSVGGYHSSKLKAETATYEALIAAVGISDPMAVDYYDSRLVPRNTRRTAGFLVGAAGLTLATGTLVWTSFQDGGATLGYQTRF
jgi:hypothetical protein